MASVEYIVEIAIQGAPIVTGNVEFTLGIEDLADIPVITGPTLNIVRATSVMRPFTVLALDSDGLLTDLFINGGRWAAIGRLARVRQSVDGGGFSIIGNGRISSIDESDGPGRYRIEIADESWVARNSEIFTLSDTTQLWPQGVVADWLGFGAAEVGTAIVSDYTNFDFPGDSVSRRVWLRHEGRGRLITESLIRWLEERLVDSPEPPGNANSSADNFPGVRLNYGGVDYPIISFTRLEGTNVSAIDFLQTLKLRIDPDDDAVNFLIFFRSVSTPPLPPQPAFIHIVSDEPPSKDLPLHIGVADASHPWGTAQGWIHPATLTRRVWDEIEVRYDDANISALEADTSLPPLAFDVTEVVKDPERWLLDNVWVPLLLAPSFNSLGERTLIDMRLPQDLDPDTLPLLDATNTNQNTWTLAGRDTVNSITWTYAHYFEPPQDQANRDSGEGPPPEGRTDIRMDGLIYSERQAPQRPGVDTDAVSINSVGEISIGLRLPGALKRSESTLGLPIFIDRGPAMFDGVTAQVSREVLDIFKDGAYRLRGEVARTASESMVAGDLVLLDLGSIGLPNPASGARSDLRLVRVMGITRYPAYAEIDFLDLGPNAQPLAAPTIEVDFFASPRRVEVVISNIPAGATATLEFAYTTSSSEPTRWPIRRANLTNGTYTFRDVPATGFAHARVRSVAPGRIRSVWAYDFVGLTLIPSILNASVAIDGAGVPTIALEASSAVGGIRLRLAVHGREQDPVFGPNDDHAVGEFPLVLAGVVVPSSSAFSAEIEPWTGFSGGSVTGAAGDVVRVSTLRGVVSIPLTMAADVDLSTPGEAQIELRVADPRPDSNITITYTADGVGVTPASPQTLPAASVTSELATTGFLAFTAELNTVSVVRFVATAPNRVQASQTVTFGIAGTPGAAGNAGRLRMWGRQVGAGVADAVVEVQHDTGESGELFVWVNPLSAATPNPDVDPPDGSVVFGSTTFVADDATSFALTGGGFGTLLNNFAVSAKEAKTIFARADFDDGTSALGQAAITGVIDVVDDFGVLENGSVDTAALALEAVTNINIAERAVAFRNLVVGSFENMIPDPGFESGDLALSDWTVRVAGGGTFLIQGGNPRSGSFALQYTRAGQTTTAAIQHTASGMTCEAGDRFLLRGWFRGTGSGGGTSAGAQIVFRDAAGGIIDDPDHIDVCPVGTYVLRTVESTAPAGAVTVHFEAVVLNNGTTSSIRIDDFFGRLMVPGTLIVDGAIIADHLSANSVTSNAIAANNILAVHIAADQVTAAKINVTTLDAITADVGILTAGQLRNAGNTAGVLLSGTLPGTWTSYLRLTATGTQAFLQHSALQLLANGNATFSGALSAASGTFAGNLSAAGGTFAGSLTANDVTFGSTGRLRTGFIADTIELVNATDGGNVYVGFSPTVGFVRNNDVIIAGSDVGSTLGFFGTTGTTKPGISGSRGGNVALADLLSSLDAMGLINDATSP